MGFGCAPVTLCDGVGIVPEAPFTGPDAADKFTRGIRMPAPRCFRRVAILAVTAGLVIAPAAQALASTPAPFLAKFHKIATIGSTVPGNGDVNPYGTVVIRSNHGKLRAGNILISNFNNRANLQGTGTTIVQLDPATGRRTLFAHISGPLPLLLPRRDRAQHGSGGTPGWLGRGGQHAIRRRAVATAKAGCLIVLNSAAVRSRRSPALGINGPWDMTRSGVGHHRRAVRDQRAERHRERQGGSLPRHRPADPAADAGPGLVLGHHRDRLGVPGADRGSAL